MEKENKKGILESIGVATIIIIVTMCFGIFAHIGWNLITPKVCFETVAIDGDDIVNARTMNSTLFAVKCQ